MSRFRVGVRAGRQIDEIYRYTAERWGDAQAERYIRGLFDQFEAIAGQQSPWRAIPAEFGVEGFFRRYESHFIYWRLLSDGMVGFVAVLHVRMHQIRRLRDEFR